MMKTKEGKESNVSMERNHFREVVNTFSGSGILHEEGEWGGVLLEMFLVVASKPTH